MSSRLTFVVLLSACGFEGAAPFAGARSADVAPWQDLGPLLICQDTLRLGVPDSKAAGLCIAANRPDANACTSDDQCASRERCTCGGCQVATCTDIGECTGGFVCTFADGRCDRACTVDSDCAKGELCVPEAGVCRGRCATDADCQVAETCDAGMCIATLCMRDLDCAGACAMQRTPATLKEPSPVLLPDGTIVLYMERIDGMTASIWRATSKDGLRFALAPSTAPVIAPDAGDAGRAGGPTVLSLGNAELFSLVYANGAGRLRLAFPSSDGIHFDVRPLPLLAPSSSLDSSGLDAPTLVHSPTSEFGLLLYYSTRDGSGIGLASADDIHPFAPQPAFALAPSSVTSPVWQDVNLIDSPFAEPFTAPDGTRSIRLWFAARGLESGDSQQFGMTVPEAPNFSIGMAATLDGTTLVPYPYDPTFDRTLQFLDHLGEHDPAVLETTDSDGNPRLLLYYRGTAADDSHSTNLGVAVSPPSL